MHVNPFTYLFGLQDQEREDLRTCPLDIVASLFLVIVIRSYLRRGSAIPSPHLLVREHNPRCAELLKVHES